jgi:hypothetical protein
MPKSKGKAREKAGQKAPEKAGRKAGKPAQDAPEVLYPDLAVEMHLGEEALTSENMKAMLGWEEEPAGAKWGDLYLLTDHLGKKIRCANNAHNRPFTEGWAKQLAYDLLNRNWADSRNGVPGSRTVNGETIIVGRTGRVLSAQHRGVALVLASQIWAGQPHWKEVWPDGPPTMEAIVVYGVSEDPAVVRTLDNTRPRSLSDVLYTEQTCFGKLSNTERLELCRILEAAVRVLWDRTGAREDAFAPYSSHSECLEFIQRHPRIIRCVKHIHDENKKVRGGAAGAGKKKAVRPLEYYVKPGTSSALMYLMAASATDINDYRTDAGGAVLDLRERGEDRVDFRHWDKAVQFWSDLSGGRLTQVRQAVASLSGPEGDIQVSADHKVAVVCKAWPHYLEEEDFDVKDILPKFGPVNEAGKRKLAEAVDLRGLDLGSTIDRALAKAAQRATEGHPDDEEAEETDLDEGTEDEEWEEAGEDEDQSVVVDQEGEADPTPEEIAAAAEHQRKVKETKRQRDKDKLIANRAERKRTARQAEMQATVQAATQGPAPVGGAAAGGPAQQ